MPRNGSSPVRSLIEDHSQTIDVAAAVHLVGFAGGLLGTHVGRRAQDLAVHGHGDLAGVALRQAEVHEVRLALGVEHDVARLEVAVDDAGLVGVLEGVGDLRAELGRLAGRESLPGEPVGQRQAPGRNR